MHHKIIQIANNTLALCIPKAFIQKLGLKKGDILSTSILNQLMIIKKESSTVQIQKDLWNNLNVTEKIKLLKFLNRLGFEKVLVPDISQDLKTLSGIRIHRLNDCYFELEFVEREELKELQKIFYLFNLFFETFEDFMNHEILFKIRQKINHINHHNLLREVKYNIEKYIILQKILDSIEEILSFLQKVKQKTNLSKLSNLFKLVIDNYKKMIFSEDFDEIIRLSIENHRIIKNAIFDSSYQEYIDIVEKLNILR